MNVLFPNYSDQTLSVKYAFGKQPSLETETQNTAEITNAFNGNATAITADSVDLSPEAEKLINDKPQKIDWENRTYLGQKLPDSYVKDLTPEMISGEQPYIVIHGHGEIWFQKSDYTEQERIFNFDAQMLEGKLNNIVQYEDRLVDISKQKNLLYQTSENVRTAVSQHLNLRESDTINFLQYQKNDIKSYVKSMMQTYSDFHIDYDDARQGILHFSDGKIDLDNILSTYFTN